MDEDLHNLKKLKLKIKNTKIQCESIHREAYEDIVEEALNSILDELELLIEQREDDLREAYRQQQEE